MTFPRRLAVLLAVLVPVAPAAAQSGKVSGTLTVNGTKVPVKHIMAVTYDTPHPGRLVSVLVSDKLADPKAFKDYTRIGPGEKYVAGMITGAWVAMHAEDKAFQGFSFTLNTEKRAILTDVLVGATREDNFSILDDYLVVEITSTSPRLVGRIRTKEPMMELNTERVGIDLTFDAPVVEVGQ